MGGLIKGISGAVDPRSGRLSPFAVFSKDVRQDFANIREARGLAVRAAKEQLSSTKRQELQRSSVAVQKQAAKDIGTEAGLRKGAALRKEGRGGLFAAQEAASEGLAAQRRSGVGPEDIDNQITARRLLPESAGLTRQAISDIFQARAEGKDVTEQIRKREEFRQAANIAVVEARGEESRNTLSFAKDVDDATRLLENQDAANQLAAKAKEQRQLIKLKDRLEQRAAKKEPERAAAKTRAVGAATLAVDLERLRAGLDQDGPTRTRRTIGVTERGQIVAQARQSLAQALGNRTGEDGLGVLKVSDLPTLNTATAMAEGLVSQGVPSSVAIAASVRQVTGGKVTFPEFGDASAKAGRAFMRGMGAVPGLGSIVQALNFPGDSGPANTGVVASVRSEILQNDLMQQHDATAQFAIPTRTEAEALAYVDKLVAALNEAGFPVVLGDEGLQPKRGANIDDDVMAELRNVMLGIFQGDGDAQ